MSMEALQPADPTPATFEPALLLDEILAETKMTARRRGLRGRQARRPGLHRRARRAEARGREGRQGLRRRAHRRDRRQALAPDRRDPPQPDVPEARVGVARPQVRRRPHRLPREHQGRAPQLLEGRPARRLRGRARGAEERPLQDRLLGGVRPVRRQARRRDRRELRVRPRPAGHRAPPEVRRPSRPWRTRPSSPPPARSSSA